MSSHNRNVFTFRQPTSSYRSAAPAPSAITAEIGERPTPEQLLSQAALTAFPAPLAKFTDTYSL